ncbi:S-layer homology domain-containing protein [Paenibacillus plantarum]|uniref:S-layer homology domain-containing protein n=1 Tax=Paenibacillus plantarum TaxID=2654975 RepID=UPI0028A5FD1E|nr:S-layer homology domain-containing protein [Paenibacillus plantarum]
MKSITGKVSRVLALFMFVSILVPVIAYGATLGIKSYTYDKTTGSVTATVYSDVYDNVSGAVYLNMYAPNSSLLKKTYMSDYTNTTTVNGVTYYNFTFNTGITANVYDAVYLEGEYNSTVSSRVYATDANPDVPGCVINCGGGYGGGGGWIPPVTGTSISVPSNGEVNEDSLKNALASSANVELKLFGDIALIPAAALVDSISKSGSMITVISDNGTYMLPLSILDLNALAKSLGIAMKDLKIKVGITKLIGDSATAVSTAAKAIGGKTITDAVDFNVIAVGPDGKTTSIDFGKTYVSRSLNISNAVDSKMVTGVLYNETTKKLSFVPAIFEVKDGKTVATLKRNDNSIYTVVEMNKNFTDIESHWSKNDVSLLTNKLVIDGMTDTTFAPDLNITRAEFAALAVRSLGLNLETTTSTFSDVQASDWYATTVATAAKAGIIDGYEDGFFKPNAQITREELTAMIVRTMNYAGLKSTISESQQLALLNNFSDSDQIIWAQKEMATAIDAGIINGLTETTIVPSNQATRAEAAAMLKRFLSKAGFIN